jgi:hypothetical protein|tara:strand:+ start:15856 stop:16110 length:255 start_codon:yes stop_codon:yes gene_type:complete
MKHFKTFTLATAGLATLGLSNAPVLANTADDQLVAAPSKEIAMVDKALHSAREQPANRDYHSVLSNFEGDSEGDYKFSGCGSAI